MWDALGYLLTFLLFVTSIFLILLVLVQRGKGGGLVGALGGMGGQSAFGAKAGGIFWATSVAAGVWILLCILSVTYNAAGNRAFAGVSGANANRTEGAPNAVEPVTDPAKSGAGTGTPATGSGAANTGASSTTGATAPATGTQPKGEVSGAKDFADEAAPADGKAK